MNDDLFQKKYQYEKLVKDLDKSKYTIVLWIEGSDPECTDNILGGEFKVHMDFKSENTEEGEGIYGKKK